MAAFAEGVKRKVDNLSKGSKSNVRLCETVIVRSRIETIASTIKKLVICNSTRNSLR